MENNTEMQQILMFEKLESHCDDFTKVANQLSKCFIICFSSNLVDRPQRPLISIIIFIKACEDDECLMAFNSQALSLRTVLQLRHARHIKCQSVSVELNGSTLTYETDPKLTLSLQYMIKKYLPFNYFKYTVLLNIWS